MSAVWLAKQCIILDTYTADLLVLCRIRDTTINCNILVKVQEIIDSKLPEKVDA